MTGASRPALLLGLMAVLATAACQRPAPPTSPPGTAPASHEVQAVQRRLREMVAADQEARRNRKPWAAIDQANTAEMKRLLQRFGWITISRFGANADRDAWLLVQHADQDPAFQEEVLARLEPLVRSGETSRRSYAYLYDRTALKRGARNTGVIEIGADGQPPGRQRYGTQGTCIGSHWEPFALERPAEVDRLRAEVGLGPLDEYRKLFDCR